MIKKLKERKEYTMAFSKFLDAKRQDCKNLVAELRKSFAYVSVLGVDIKTTGIRVDRNTSNIGPGRDTECGFVVKMHNGTVFYEYSLDDISGDIPTLAAKKLGRWQGIALLGIYAAFVVLQVLIAVGAL